MEPQVTRVRQQHDYEKALARYDQDERAEGYRWASRNRVVVARYCKVAAKRTTAFMMGCMDYIGSRSGRGEEQG